MERSSRRREAPSAGASMRDRIRQRLNEQEAAGGAWAVDTPQDRTITLKENQKGGICLKRFDFLPYKTSDNPEVSPGEIWWRRQYGVHRNIGIDLKTRLCLHATYGKPCPVDAYQADMYKSAKTKEDKDTAKALYVKKRDLYNVIDLDDEDKGPQVFDISYHLFGKQLKTELDMAADYKYDSFADLKGGWTLVCRFKKKSFGEQEFYEIDRIDFEERGDYPDSILEETHDLDSLLKPLSYEALEKELLGQEEPPVREEREERKPTRREAPEPERKPMRRSAPEPTPEERTERVPFSKKDETPAEETPRRPLRRREPEPEAESDTLVCAFGYEFGVDTDSKDECLVKCKKEIYDACGEAYDTRVKSKKK